MAQPEWGMRSASPHSPTIVTVPANSGGKGHDTFISFHLQATAQLYQSYSQHGAINRRICKNTHSVVIKAGRIVPALARCIFATEMALPHPLLSGPQRRRKPAR